MKAVVQDFIDLRNPESLQEYDRALRELIQHIVLLGLWRAGFFEHAAFYGGTALRILHTLPRFSEDIDLSLLERRPNFSLSSYLAGLRTELSGFGFEVDVVSSDRLDSPIESAFVKANTRYHLLQVQPGSALASTVPANQLLKIKLEVDTVPPGEFDTEVVPVLEPIPFSVRTLSLPDLFAGKMHCVLFRRWKSRVKGRDWYDLIWFLRKRVPLHLAHLEERMRQSGDWREERQFAIEDLLCLYDQRVDQVDFSNAAADVLPFIQDPRELDIWNRTFFSALRERILIC
ncbi:MAG: nucleotidyl transferase AbiEii/AbiGii toxin family protein [Spirochaetaceae bacterium]|nr:MAG: nucleotidyl transferase AbiEii/AbiGii toxin family protein [Spirochaetaceae bacterium]